VRERKIDRKRVNEIERQKYIFTEKDTREKER
jgi:hypothetical protein